MGAINVGDPVPSSVCGGVELKVGTPAPWRSPGHAIYCFIYRRGHGFVDCIRNLDIHNLFLKGVAGDEEWFVCVYGMEAAIDAFRTTETRDGVYCPSPKIVTQLKAVDGESSSSHKRLTDAVAEMEECNDRLTNLVYEISKLNKEACVNLTAYELCDIADNLECQAENIRKLASCNPHDDPEGGVVINQAYEL